MCTYHIQIVVKFTYEASGDQYFPMLASYVLCYQCTPSYLTHFMPDRGGGCEGGENGGGGRRGGGVCEHGFWGPQPRQQQRQRQRDPLRAPDAHVDRQARRGQADVAGAMGSVRGRGAARGGGHCRVRVARVFGGGLHPSRRVGARAGGIGDLIHRRGRGRQGRVRGLQRRVRRGGAERLCAFER